MLNKIGLIRTHLFLWQGPRDFVDEVAEEEEEHAGRKSSQNDEAQSKISSKISRPKILIFIKAFRILGLLIHYNH